MVKVVNKSKPHNIEFTSFTLDDLIELINDLVNKPDNAAFAYDTIEVLIERRIARDRAHLSKLIARAEFPRGLKMSDALQARRLFPQVEVHRWLQKILRPAPHYPP